MYIRRGTDVSHAFAYVLDFCRWAWNWDPASPLQQGRGSISRNARSDTTDGCAKLPFYITSQRRYVYPVAIHPSIQILNRTVCTSESIIPKYDPR